MIIHCFFCRKYFDLFRFFRIMASKLMIKLTEKVVFIKIDQFFSESFKENDEKLYDSLIEVNKLIFFLS